MEEVPALVPPLARQPEWFWAEQAKAISWLLPWQGVLDVDYEEVDFAWFSGGRSRAFNCIDRHPVPSTAGDHLGHDEPGAYQHITTRLKHTSAAWPTCCSTRRQERRPVCITCDGPELVYTMLACGGIGAIHSVSSRLSARILRDRIVDASCKVVVPAKGVAGREEGAAQAHG